MTEEIQAETETPESTSDEQVEESASESPSESTDESEAKTEESTSEEKAEEDAEPEEWKNLLKKYNGDKGKAATSYWNTVKDNARLAKEAKDYKAKLEAYEKAKAEPKKDEGPHPSLKEIDDYVTALTNECRDVLPRKEAELFTQYEKDKRAVWKCEDELETADEMDKRAIRADLAAAKLNQKATEQDIKALQSDYKFKQQEIQRAAGYRKQVEDRLDSEARAKQEQEESDKAFNEDFPNEIDEYITKHFDQLKLAPGVREAGKGIIYEHLLGFAAKFRGTGEDADKDWEGLVRNKAEEFKKLCDLLGRSEFKKFSKETKKVLPAGKPAVTVQKADETPKYDDGLTPAMRKARERLAGRGL